ncbi:DUF2062 domain-containing protein [Halorubrum sp. JWXQ-INN 858]|uniref:DUF2062 domain-containing protein n=1 Tax=Halorubrum sp. JWXQ-INN 858 TaxID=2690782 RepID=UPI0013571214|nr:DUF2062 domain-containing protein [Halorubrum sp. JWXQ-INN 858]MWV64342.1 DUF2062 domain-containing protein [Halorubrum sp. JWXQ-INN 858]
MILSRVEEWTGRVKAELQRSFAEEYSSRETAGSFALGVFITMLPTLGTGLIVFVALAWLFDRINRVALFASVLVFNPVVKWGVYAASFTLGVLILGPVPGVTSAEVSLSAGPEIVTRLLVGNVILAVVAAVPGYFVCHRLVEAYQARGVDIVETIEEVVGPDQGVVGPDEKAVGPDGGPVDAAGEARSHGDDAHGTDGGR